MPGDMELQLNLQAQMEEDLHCIRQGRLLVSLAMGSYCRFLSRRVTLRKQLLNL